MVPEVLEGMLWLVRLGLRCQVGTVRAGHGYADASFRPASLPFVSLIGPLGIEVEPERDLPVASDVLVQLPGFVRGAPRAAELIPAGATLALMFDRDASVEIALDAGDLATPAAAASVCADIEAKVRAAVVAGDVRDLSGGSIDDPIRRAELAAAVCRWDEASSSVVLSSGRQGYISQLAPSTVDVNGGTAAGALGFAAPIRGEPGRHARHRAPAPKGFAIDVRLDLWAANQRDLGYLIDALIRTVPTRTRLVTRPAILAAALAPGDTTLRLLDAAEPTTPDSLLHLEATDGFLDRVTDSALEVTSTASAQLDPHRLSFSGNGVARKIIARTPAVPDPRRADALAPNGAALTLGLRLVDGLEGHAGQLVTLQSGGQPILELGYSIENAPSGAEAALVADLTARAMFRGFDGTFGTASVTRRVPLAMLASGVSLHVVAQSGPGVVSIAIDGTAQDLANGEETPSPAVAAAGAFAVADDLSIQLGNAAGNPAPFELDHVHLQSAPVPALDPRLRASANAASQFRPGDHIALGDSDRGLLPIGQVEAFYVRSVAGDTVALDRPIRKHWTRRTLVHARDCFVQQREVKRRDDLMNRLYRYSVGYRVSTFLEQADTAITGGLVIMPMVDVEPMSSSKVAAGAPGVHTRVLSSRGAGPIPQPRQE